MEGNIQGTLQLRSWKYPYIKQKTMCQMEPGQQENFGWNRNDVTSKRETWGQEGEIQVGNRIS